MRRAALTQKPVLHQYEKCYTIVEFSMIGSRTVEAKKRLIRPMFERVQPLGISPQDLEMTIFETPKHNWGFRGLPGDEHQLIAPAIVEHAAI